VCKWEDNIKIDVKGTAYEDVNRTELAQDFYDGDELSGSITELLDHLNKCQQLKKDNVPCN
jgi:hypothetical protein